MVLTFECFIREIMFRGNKNQQEKDVPAPLYLGESDL